MRNRLSGLWAVILICLLRTATASTASWVYPNVDGLIINYIDTIFLQWTSDFTTAYLQMWCQNGTTGNNVVLGSQSPVVTSGKFGYVLLNQDPAQVDFPVACHAAIVPDPAGGGVDAPFGLTFTSQLKVAAQTFAVSTSTSASSSSTTTTSSSTSSAIIPSSSSQRTTSTIATPGSISESTPQATSQSPSTTSTSSVPASTASNAPAIPATSTSTTNNNLGPIVGGVIGGIALLCFVIFGAMFLRRYRRDPKEKKDPSGRRSSWWHKSAYRTTEMQTGGLHEIEGSTTIRHEKEGSTPSVRYEKEGDLAMRHEIDGRAKSKIWTLAVAELPS